MEVNHDFVYTFMWLVGFLGHISAQGTDTEPELRYACWGSFGPPVVSAQCPRNTVIQVRRAGLKVQSRGGQCSFNEEDCGCDFGDPGCNMPDVRDECMGRSACRLDVTQQYINSETCQGFSDYMFIQFNCVPARRGSDQDICATTATSQEQGFLHSPNYPHTYPKNRLCECSLTTSPGDVISLSLLDFHAEDDSCLHSSLRMSHDGEQKKICSNSVDQHLADSATEIRLLFDTDNEGGKGGFWLKYKAQPSTLVKIKCRSVYKPPPSTAATASTAVTVEVTTPESTSKLRFEEHETTTMLLDTTPLPPPPKRKPPLRRRPISRRPQSTPRKEYPTTGSPATGAPTLQPTRPSVRMPGRKREPVSRRGHNNMHVGPKKTPRIPKPTPWWWKFTLGPTDEMHSETTTRGLVPAIEKNEVTLEEDNINNIYQDVDEAEGHIPIDDFSINEISNPDSNFLQPIPDSMLPPPAFIPSNELQPVLQDNPPAISPKDMDPSNPPSADALPPPFPANTNTDRKTPPQHQAFYGEESSLTVTIVAACVIGGILLIIVVGILVRFMINKADPDHQMRQMHKKECVLRRNAKILNKGAKGKSFA